MKKNMNYRKNMERHKRAFPFFVNTKKLLATILFMKHKNKSALRKEDYFCLSSNKIWHNIIKQGMLVF